MNKDFYPSFKVMISHQAMAIFFVPFSSKTYSNFVWNFQRFWPWASLTRYWSKLSKCASVIYYSWYRQSKYYKHINIWLYNFIFESLQIKNRIEQMLFYHNVLYKLLGCNVYITKHVYLIVSIIIRYHYLYFWTIWTINMVPHDTFCRKNYFADKNILSSCLMIFFYIINYSCFFSNDYQIYSYILKVILANKSNYLFQIVR